MPATVKAVLMDLAELILNAKGDRSLRDLARDSERLEAPLSAAAWHQLARPDSRKNFPDPATIRTIAAVLGVPQRVVVLAAAESLGLDVADRESDLARMLPAGARELTDRQVVAVLSVVQAFLDVSAQTQMGEVNFVLPDVTAPEPPSEPSAAERHRAARRTGHGG